VNDVNSTGRIATRQPKALEAQPKGPEIRSWGAVGLFYAWYFGAWSIDWIATKAGGSSKVDPFALGGLAGAAAMLTISIVVFIKFPAQRRRLSLRASPASIVAAVVIGFLGANAVAAVQLEIGGLEFPSHDSFSIVTLVILVPVAEEMLVRGIILNTLLVRQRLYIAVAISCILSASSHESFWSALCGQLILSITFVYFRRSLTVSAAAHSFLNLTATFPTAILLHTRAGFHP
jgi:membrane protease YdiL (CAAX protease family)